MTSLQEILAIVLLSCLSNRCQYKHYDDPLLGSGHYLMLAPSDVKSGMFARLKTKFMHMKDTCVELFYMPAGLNTNLVVMVVREDLRAVQLYEVCIILLSTLVCYTSLLGKFNYKEK